MLQLTRTLRINQGNRISKAAFWGYTLFLFLVTLIPMSALDSGEGRFGEFFKEISFGGMDKFAHFFLFLFFTLLMYYSQMIQKKPLIFGAAVATGVVIEILQEIMGLGRTFELLDIAADSLGAIVGLTILNRLTS